MSNKVIEIKNLSYIYPDGTLALKEINLDIYEGEAVGIIGSNGAGKSTLLLHLNGILNGNGNSQVKILDLEVKDKNLAKIRSKVGLVFQDPDNQLFMPTVYDDVSFGPVNMGWGKDKIEISVKKALKDVDMEETVGRMAHHLSFGEKKRISVATVLAMGPEILALDEPSSNLDPKHRRELINLLKKLPLTKLIATHDLDLVTEICSRVVLMDKGKLIAQGETLRILKDKELLETHQLEVPHLLS